MEGTGRDADLSPGGWLMFSGEACRRQAHLSTSGDRQDGHPSLTLGAEGGCWGNELRNYCPAAGRIPSPSLAQAQASSKRSLVLPKPSAGSQLEPRVAPSPGNRHGTSWVLPTLPAGAQGPAHSTGHSPASHSHHGSWQGIFHELLVASTACSQCPAGQWPPAPSKRADSSQSGKTRLRGEITPFLQKNTPQLEIHSSEPPNPA